jgi:hypothetical protein
MCILHEERGHVLDKAGAEVGIAAYLAVIMVIRIISGMYAAIS